MEKVRSVYPNAMHVERNIQVRTTAEGTVGERKERHKMDDLSLFRAFYQEVKETTVTEETEAIFKEVLQELLQDENEQSKQAVKETVAAKN
jgi:exonuclease SbcD